MNLDVLLEDNHCLVVNKPAGLLSQGDKTSASSLVDVVAQYLKSRYRKPGNVYVGLLHRLDRPTSGVMLLAKTSKAARRLAAQFRSGTVSKLYWAVVEGSPPVEQGEWIDRIEKDRQTNRAVILPECDVAGKEARVRIQVLKRRAGLAMVELRPVTGRGHQLRAQLAKRGLPILGDVRYGATGRVPACDGGYRIALHARELSFMHPTRAETITVVAPVPGDWPGPWR
jgi:23S rRNA pseudouridine1911/1915/1917 synthase